MSGGKPNTITVRGTAAPGVVTSGQSRIYPQAGTVAVKVFPGRRGYFDVAGVALWLRDVGAGESKPFATTRQPESIVGALDSDVIVSGAILLGRSHPIGQPQRLVRPPVE